LLESTLQQCSAIFYNELNDLKAQVAKLKEDKQKIERQWLTLSLERDTAMCKVRMLEGELRVKSNPAVDSKYRPVSPSSSLGTTPPPPPPPTTPYLVKEGTSKPDDLTATTSTPIEAAAPVSQPESVPAANPEHLADSSTAAISESSEPIDLSFDGSTPPSVVESREISTPIRVNTVSWFTTVPPVPKVDPLNLELTQAEREAEAERLFSELDATGEKLVPNPHTPELNLKNIGEIFYCANDKYFCKLCLQVDSYCVCLLGC
jgi:hypothetical protein